MLQYWELSGLEHIYLEDSWVLDIAATPATLRVDCEFVLTEAHADYRRPRAGEMYCYSRGALIFRKVADLVWKQQDMAPAVDTDGEIDFGGIDSFTITEGEFSFEGDFGTIRLRNDGTVSVLYFSDSTENS